MLPACSSTRYRPLEITPVKRARLPLERHLLIDLRLRQLRADENARAWGLRGEAEADVDAFLDAQRFAV